MADNPTHDPREPFASEREAARYLNLSTRTLQRWRVEPPAAGAIPFYRLGKRVAYKLSELSAWAARRRFGSTSEADAADANAATLGLEVATGKRPAR